MPYKIIEAELAEELERYAISLYGSADMDTSQVGANCVSEHIDRAMGLLAEVVLEPTFAEDEFEKLRKQVGGDVNVVIGVPADAQPYPEDGTPVAGVAAG